MSYKDKLIRFENAKLAFRNFRGEKREMNNEGDRNFNVILDDDTAEDLSSRGIKVRRWVPRGKTEDEGINLLKVHVSYEKVPPKVIIISGGKKVAYDEAMIGELDYIEIDSVDLTLSPSFYIGRDGSDQCRVFLDGMWLTQLEDAFDEKYAHIPYGDRGLESDIE